MHPPRALAENLSLNLPAAGDASILGILWLVEISSLQSHGLFHVSSHCLSSVYLCTLLSSFYKDTVMLD